MKQLNGVFIAVALILFAGAAMATGNLNIFVVPGESHEAVERSAMQ